MKLGLVSSLHSPRLLRCLEGFSPRGNHGWKAAGIKPRTGVVWQRCVVCNRVRFALIPTEALQRHRSVCEWAYHIVEQAALLTRACITHFAVPFSRRESGAAAQIRRVWRPALHGRARPVGRYQTDGHRAAESAPQAEQIQLESPLPSASNKRWWRQVQNTPFVNCHTHLPANCREVPKYAALHNSIPGCRRPPLHNGVQKRVLRTG